MIEIIRIFLILMFLHALADFSFQSDAMAKGKNRLTQIEIKEGLPMTVWTKKRAELTKKDIKIHRSNYINGRFEYFEFHEKRLPNGQKFINCWFYWMSAHALIQGGLIMMVFPKFWYLGAIEMIAHFLTDFGKCEQRYNVHTDQFFHLLFRLCYLWIMVI